MRRALLSSLSFSSVAVAITIAACSGGSDLPDASDGGAIDGNTDGTATVDGTATTDANGPGPNDGSSSATPQTIITFYGGAAAGCVTVPSMLIGDFPDPQAGKPARPVKNGEAEDAGYVTVTCRVAPAGGSFAFKANVSYLGTDLELTGTVDSAGKTTAGNMTLARAGTIWTNSACTFDSSASPSMGVAAGRYWGMVSCMQSTSSTNAKCDIFGQVRFENCTQN